MNVHHGTNRVQSVEEFKAFNVVITTYQVLVSEVSSLSVELRTYLTHLQQFRQHNQANVMGDGGVSVVPSSVELYQSPLLSMKW